jgi:ATPase subunit of ABC transporter with duplicated ATPase domains
MVISPLIMSDNSTIVRFNEVSFEFHHTKPILDEASFTVRRGSKITFMGQNGAGKSTVLKLMNGELKPESGRISLDTGLTIATAHQVIKPEDRNKTLTEFFEQNFPEKVYDIDRRIDNVLEVVNLKADHNRVVKSFSGGQQARLLLASALIQEPDLLLLDEPTNNLDPAGIEHLTSFLVMYDKTCIVISHDADFLNSFSDGVLYLDVFTHKVEQYVGNYFDVGEQIEARIAKENRKNAQLAQEIQRNKDQANVFAHKGGGMRLVAKKMREKAAEMEAAKVDVRQEDKTIKPFTIPVQEDLIGTILTINSFTALENHEPITKKANIHLKKKQHLLLAGPNGIGKSTLLEAIATGKAEGSHIADGVRVGYYRQDFSSLNTDDTVYESLVKAAESANAKQIIEKDLRSLAASFLITSETIMSKIGSLSEGQKGLVSFACLILQKPGLLILDEPTNHINFRHLPVIAEALDKFEGAMVLVSHVPEFVSQIRIDETLDLTK